MSHESGTLRRTPLHDAHVALGGRMVDFAGWSMPVRYDDGTIAEHRAVRSSAGLFDVSHMGQLAVDGPGAALDLQRLLSNDVDRLEHDGDAQYTLLTNEQGGIEDDLILYRLAPDRFLLVVNAANAAHDLELVRRGVGNDAEVTDASALWAMLALQGPVALDVLAERLPQADVRGVAPFQARTAVYEGAPLLVATTGYTGELGVELLVHPQVVRDVWDALVDDPRVTPAGLGARDTLRLEASLPLHGSDIDASTDAISAGLGWACAFTTEFTGRDALRSRREAGTAERLVSLRAQDRGVPRAGCGVFADGRQIGHVTSGTMSPTLGTGIALAYVRTDHATPGTQVTIDVRGRTVAAVVAQRPLYRRPARGSDLQ